MSATGRIMMASILTMLMLLACRTPPPAPARQAVHLLDLAPVAVFAGDTTRLIPPTESSRGLLETGWEMPAEEDSVEALWRPGERGEARFYIVHPASMTLRTELFSEVPERVEVLVNGKNVGSFACKEQWNTYQLRLQPEVLTAGWNTLALSFKAGQGSAQGTRGCRLLELQPVGWKSAAEPNLGARLSQGGRLLATPFRTSFTVYLDLGTESRLSGQIKRTEMGKGLACLELRNWKGQYETLLETDQEKEFELDLSAWDGQIVELRLSCKGTPGSAVSWADPVLSWREGTSRNRTQPVRLEEPPSSGRLGRQNIIVIMLDAARADAFGPETTPRCQAIAEEGTIFSRAHSPADWTAQSVAALMTGLYPGTLGVDSWASSLPQDVPRMAEIMQDRGYHTGVWTEHNLWGFEPPSLELWKGFDVSLEMFLEQSPVRTDVRVPSVEQLFDPTRPNFVFLHLLPPHLPYAPPAPFFGCRTSWYKGKLSCTDLEIQNINNRIATPSEQDIRWCVWGFLLAARAHNDGVRYEDAYLRALAEVYELPMPIMLDAGEADYSVLSLIREAGR